MKELIRHINIIASPSGQKSRIMDAVPIISIGVIRVE